MPSPHSFVGRVCIGLILAGAACPIAGPAQTVNGATPTPMPNEPVAIEPPSTSNPSVPPGTTPTQPGTPFGAAPGTFPGLAPAPTSQPTNPFGAAPGTFPDLSTNPSPTTSAQPTNPFGAAPGTFPGLAPNPASANPVQPGEPTAPAPTATSPQLTNPIPNTTLVPGALAPAALNPGYGFGTPAPPIPGAAPFVPLTPPAPPNFAGLAPVAPGALPVQAGDLRAPPILINSSIFLSEGYTDNPNNTPQTLSDLITTLGTNTNFSFDSSRLQGQLTSSLNYTNYARTSNQDALNQNVLGFGLATIVPDHLFVDGRAAVTQVSTTGGVGFASSTLIPASQQSQAWVTSLTPIWRESFGDLIDAEFRYNYALSLFNNGTVLGNTTPVPTATTGTGSLSNTSQNEATLTFATGRAFNSLTSKLTLDATKIDSVSAARSAQLQAYDDLDYAINPMFSAQARVGYEDIRYALQPSANVVGPIWLIGGRWSPQEGDYLVLRYGSQKGVNGFSGQLAYQVTARTTVLASLDNGLASSQQSIVSNLNTSQLGANGTIVNQITGLPSALTNPEFAFASNSIYKTKDGSISIQTVVDRDTFQVLGFISQQVLQGTPLPSTVSPAAGTDTALGLNFNWGRSLTPLLSTNVSLGYARETAGHQDTVTADWRLNYTVSETFTGVLHYQFINVDSPSTATFANSYRRNLIEIGVTKSF